MAKGKCDECVKEFILQMPWQRFCSYECQQTWHRRKYRAIRDWWKEQGGEAQFETEERST
jgi:hypothetical protein